MDFIDLVWNGIKLGYHLFYYMVDLLMLWMGLFTVDSDWYLVGYIFD